MKIKKILNNNLVLASDDKQEKLLLGRGIGFNNKIGDQVDSQLTEKTFILEDSTTQLRKLIDDIPNEFFHLTHKIIQHAQNKLDYSLQDTLYVSLTDHLYYAIERKKNGQELRNSLVWEVKRFYTKEFQVALESLGIIKSDLHVQLNEDEAGFIAIHFVNAQKKGSVLHKTVEETTIIQDVLNIIRFHFKLELDETSINLSRFVTHLRFFLQRIQEIEYVGKNNSVSSDEDVFLHVRNKYPHTYECVIRIKIYFEEKLKISIRDEELLYFMLHINRLTLRELNG